MKQTENGGTIDLPLEQKHGRGRPLKIEAMSSAESPRQFFPGRSMADMPLAAATIAGLEAAQAEIRLLADKIDDLQLKLGCERQARIEAERRVTTLKAKMGK